MATFSTPQLIEQLETISQAPSQHPAWSISAATGEAARLLTDAAESDSAPTEHFIDELKSAVSSHWESLSDFIKERGSFDEGWVAWEESFSRAEGEESITNIVLEFVRTQFNIEAPDPDSK